MRVLLVNKYWYLRGGTERVLFLTKKILEEAGHEVHIFGMHHEKNTVGDRYFADFVDLGTFSLSAIGKSIYNREAKQKFAEVLDEVQPDVVHFHNVYHQLSFSLLDALKGRHVRTVMTLHDYKMLSPNYTLFHHGKIDDGSLGRKYYRCLLNNCMESYGKSVVATIETYLRAVKGWQRQIDRYIAPSVFMKDLCVKAGWNEAAIKVVPNPIDIEVFPSHSRDGGYVAYIGRLSEEKGIETYVAAAKELPQIPFRIVGDGPLKKSLETYVVKEKIKNITFDGWVSGKELVTRMQEARIIVVPSVWYENCPLSMLEAMGAGRVVIGSDIGGITEHLPAELLVPPGDPRMLAKHVASWYSCSSQKRAFMGRRLQKRVAKKHSIKRYTEALMRVYT